MTITVGGTSITFNDATTQSTAATGTVTSVATGNGLQGGTITGSGTLSVACPTFNTVGSYAFGIFGSVGTSTTVTAGSNYSAGSGASNIKGGNVESDNAGGAGFYDTNSLSGTWKWMGATRNVNIQSGSVVCRVS